MCKHKPQHHHCHRCHCRRRIGKVWRAPAHCTVTIAFTTTTTTTRSPIRKYVLCTISSLSSRIRALVHAHRHTRHWTLHIAHFILGHLTLVCLSVCLSASVSLCLSVCLSACTPTPTHAMPGPAARKNKKVYMYPTAVACFLRLSPPPITAPALHAIPQPATAEALAKTKTKDQGKGRANTGPSQAAISRQIVGCACGAVRCGEVRGRRAGWPRMCWARPGRAGLGWAGKGREQGCGGKREREQGMGAEGPWKVLPHSVMHGGNRLKGFKVRTARLID